MNFSVGTSTRIRFGEGVRQELAASIGDNTAANILVIASATSLERMTVSNLIDRLSHLGQIHIWDKVSPNPRIEDIEACLETHAARGITHIVGLGGGSALDQAKATAMALHCRVSVNELLSRKSALPRRNNYLILIPTTAGTGAELSYGAILSNKTTGEKLGLRGENMAADLALVDPELTWSAPRSISMITGFDVLTHALETWLSTAATPYTEDLSRGALSRVFRFLPDIFHDPSDPVARREMSYASMVMGINLALSTTCLPHRLQYPIGAATDTAHAAGLAAIYPAWLDHALPFARDRMASCAQWINLPQSTVDPAQSFVEAVRDLQERIELQPSLKELGVTAEMVERFPREVTGRLDTDPSFNNIEDLEKIYQAAFAS